MTREYTNKAMRSFFGAREGGQDRNQHVNTPEFLIRAILQLWTEGIELDPCSNVESIVPARHRVIAKEHHRWSCKGKKKRVYSLNKTLSFISSPKYPVTGNGGLSIEWPDFTYANTPYDILINWFKKPVLGREHLMLFPCRPNRAWACDAMDKATRICWLKPFAFEGHTQAYPTPLGLGYWGNRIMEFTEIFSHYGKIGRFIIYG